VIVSQIKDGGVKACLTFISGFLPGKLLDGFSYIKEKQMTGRWEWISLRTFLYTFFPTQHFRKKSENCRVLKHCGFSKVLMLRVQTGGFAI